MDAPFASLREKIMSRKERKDYKILLPLRPWRALREKIMSRKGAKNAKIIRYY